MPADRCCASAAASPAPRATPRLRAIATYPFLLLVLFPALVHLNAAASASASASGHPAPPPPRPPLYFVHDGFLGPTAAASVRDDAVKIWRAGLLNVRQPHRSCGNLKRSLETFAATRNVLAGRGRGGGARAREDSLEALRVLDGVAPSPFTHLLLERLAEVGHAIGSGVAIGDGVAFGGGGAIGGEMSGGDRSNANESSGNRGSGKASGGNGSGKAALGGNGEESEGRRSARQQALHEPSQGFVLDRNATFFMLSRYDGEGETYALHDDQSLDEAQGRNVRRITLLYYTDVDWGPAKGGVLRLWPGRARQGRGERGNATGGTEKEETGGAETGTVEIGAEREAEREAEHEAERGAVRVVVEPGGATAQGAGVLRDAFDDSPPSPPRVDPHVDLDGDLAGDLDAGLDAAEEGYVDVEPVGDRLVVLDSIVPHEVLSIHAPRYTIAAWFYATMPTTVPATASVAAGGGDDGAGGHEGSEDATGGREEGRRRRAIEP